MYKVMLIDDEKWVVKSLNNMINWQTHGFHIVDTAFNGIEGYEKIAQHSPDLVFTDIRMPGMDGLELIRRCVERGDRADFIIATGYKDFDYAKKAIQYGAINYCLKPFEKVEIKEALDKFSERQLAKKAIQRTEAADFPTLLHSAREPKSNDTTYGKMIAYIDEHFHEDLSLQSVADELNLNISYVSQLFRKAGNDTFLQYLTSKRIAYACGLLRDTSLSVQEVAYEAGYINYFHFARVFKKITGFSATEYREDHLKK